MPSFRRRRSLAGCISKRSAACGTVRYLYRSDILGPAILPRCYDIVKSLSRQPVFGVIRRSHSTESYFLALCVTHGITLHNPDICAISLHSTKSYKVKYSMSLCRIGSVQLPIKRPTLLTGGWKYHWKHLSHRESGCRIIVQLRVHSEKL